MCASFLLFSSETIARDLTHVLSEKASKPVIAILFMSPLLS